MQNPVAAGGVPILPQAPLQMAYSSSETSSMPHLLIQPAPTATATAQAAVLTVPVATTQIEEAHSTTEHSAGTPAAVRHEARTDDGIGEPQKRNIYRHPLFPLMALLFEKCEQATQTSECPSSDSFDVDIHAFVQHQEADHKPFFSDDPDLDTLMVKAIQVLRIHLLELEKVNDLCKDFCARYISCLKGKLQSENLLRIEGMDEGSGVLESGQQGQGQVVSPDTGVIAQPVSTLGQGQIVSGGTVYQMVQTPQGLVAQPIQQLPSQQVTSPTSSSTVIHGSTPLSQIGATSTPITPQVTSPLLLSPASDDEDDYGRGKKSKRGILPKQATQVMKSWLFQHIVHPYPTEDEKRTMAAQTNLSLLQVNNWFINARRRILQPMLDASNPEGSKTKKSKPQNRQVQRHWPDNIASMQVARTSSSQTDEDSETGQAHAEDDGSGQVVTSDSQNVLVIAEPVQPQQGIYLTDSTGSTPQIGLLEHAQQQGLQVMATMQSQNGGAIDADEGNLHLQNASSEASEVD